MNKINKGLLTIALLVPMVKPELVVKTNIITNYDELFLERYEREVIKENKIISNTSDYIYNSELEATDAANNELKDLRDLDVKICTNSKEIGNNTFDKKENKKEVFGLDNANNTLNTIKSDYSVKGYTITKENITKKTRTITLDELEVKSNEKVNDDRIFNSLEDANNAKDEIIKNNTDKLVYEVNVIEKDKSKEDNKEFNNIDSNDVLDLVKNLENDGYTVKVDYIESKDLNDIDVKDLGIELVFDNLDDANKMKESLKNKYKDININVKTNKDEKTNTFRKVFTLLNDAESYKNSIEQNTNNKVVLATIKKLDDKVNTDTKNVSKKFTKIEDAKKYINDLKNNGYDVSDLGIKISYDIEEITKEQQRTDVEGTGTTGETFKYKHFDVKVGDGNHNINLTHIDTTGDQIKETTLKGQVTVSYVHINTEGVESDLVMEGPTKDERGNAYEYTSKNRSLGSSQRVYNRETNRYEYIPTPAVTDKSVLTVKGTVTYTYNNQKYEVPYIVNGRLTEKQNKCGGTGSSHGYDLEFSKVTVINENVVIDSNISYEYTVSGKATKTTYEEQYEVEVSDTDITYNYELEGNVTEENITYPEANIKANKTINYKEYNLDINKITKDNKQVEEEYYVVEVNAEKENTDTKYNYSYEGNYNIYDIENIYGNLEVNYVNTNGESIKESIYLEELIGNKYKTSYEEEIGNYVFKEIMEGSDPEEGEYIEGTRKVTYVYDLMDSNIEVVHVMEDGSSIEDGLYDEEKNTVKVTSDYEKNAISLDDQLELEISITKADIYVNNELVETVYNENGLENVKGIVGKEDIKIVFTYENTGIGDGTLDIPTPNPQTGDNIKYMPVIMILSLSVMASIINYFKKQFNK